MTDNLDFTGRLALVTGASRGIGAAVAKALAQAGAHVVLIARTVGALEEIDDAICVKGGNATLLAMDLAKLDDVDKIGPTIAERFGKLDILVANAAMLGPLGPVHHIAPKDWERVMKLNFMANMRLVRTLDPLLRASDAGRVVFTGTTIANDGLAYWGAYAASKAALGVFAKTYAAETLQTALKINTIQPGVVATDMLHEAFPGGYPGEVKTPEEVAEQYLPLCHPSCARHGEIVAL